jgi:hypothetical protein
LIYSAVVDCLSKIDCLKQLLLQFIKLTDVHLLLKLNMKKKTTQEEKREGIEREKREEGVQGRGGKEKKREGKKTIG